jgi:hypothetical protein
MPLRSIRLALSLLSFAVLAPMGFASAADIPVKAKAKPVADLPFFFSAACTGRAVVISEIPSSSRVSGERICCQTTFRFAMTSNFQLTDNQVQMSPRFKRWTSVITPVRDHFDEGLIVPCMGAGGHGGRLAMRFGAKRRRPHVGHPDMDRAQTLRAKLRTMFHPGELGA